MASKQALRRAWWQVHKWIGLAVMILMIPIGWTGAILAWDDAIDHQLEPQRYAVTGSATLAPSVYAQAATAALGPDQRIANIRFSKDGPVQVVAVKAAPKPAETAGADTSAGAQPEHTHRHEGKGGSTEGERGERKGPPKRTTLYLDPPTARVLDIGQSDDGLVRLAHNFHGSLFIPGGVGRAIMGVIGVCLFLLAATGVWLWWPQVGSVAKGFRWLRGDRKLDTNLHHLVGFWIALPLAAQAFTGVWIAWPQMMTVAGLAPVRGGPMERGRMVPAPTTIQTPDQVLAAAEAASPGKPTMIAWPTGDEGLWRVMLSTPKGPANLEVNDTTGAAAPGRNRPGGNDLAMAMRHYHDGTTLGTAWRVFMILFGLSPTLLGVTGLLMWLRGRRWRKEADQRRRRREERGPEPLPVAAE